MPGDRSPLYVRIPTAEARKLDRAAFELGTPKQDLVAGLVARYVDPADLASLEHLAGRRRVTVETTDDSLAVGRHSFQPADPSEVLTLDQLADLLQAEPAEVERMAEAGELPGRQIAGEWRFSRHAVLAWLGSANDGGA
jgi:excisionase family DNA binding protein